MNLLKVWVVRSANCQHWVISELTCFISASRSLKTSRVNKQTSSRKQAGFEEFAWKLAGRKLAIVVLAVVVVAVVVVVVVFLEQTIQHKRLWDGEQIVVPGNESINHQALWVGASSFEGLLLSIYVALTKRLTNLLPLFKLLALENPRSRTQICIQVITTSSLEGEKFKLSSLCHLDESRRQ